MPSVVDPYHFDLDPYPDPRIRKADPTLDLAPTPTFLLPFFKQKNNTDKYDFLLFISFLFINIDKKIIYLKKII